VTEQGVLERPAADPAARLAPRLVEGTELIGRYRGSGYREPRYLVGRADGQVIQLPHVLYQLAAAVDGDRDVNEIAAHVSAQLGRRISAEQVSALLLTKLAPAGIVAGAPGTPVAKPRPDPLLLLRLRLPVVPTTVVWFIAGVFRPFYWPPVLLALLGAFVALDVALVVNGALGQVGPSAVALAQQPVLTLLVLAAVLASGVFHEFGHVAACRYGGARPGVMGVGIYLVWPAFYSTVTDSYRLSRAGRLRTDLGGVYFNAVSLAAMAAAYLVTGAPWLLLAIVALHAQTVWQFLPSIRLDGYYILSDVIGLPDLFMYLRPVLRSVLPGRPTDPRIAELKPGVRWTIIGWVLLVVPFLLFFLVLFLVLAPQVLPVIWESLLGFLAVAAAAIRDGETALATLSVVQAFFLVLPVLGVTLILGMIGRRVARTVAKRQAGAAAGRPAAAPRTGGPRPAGYLLAVAVPLALLTLLGLAGVDQRTAGAGEAATAAAAALGSGSDLAPAGWPDTVAVHQLAALDALLGGLGQPGVIDSARAVLLVAGLLGALLLWTVARRIGLPPAAAATAVAVAGLPAPVVALHASVDPGTLAALWLTVAVCLAGRGCGANTATPPAELLAVLTAPLAAVGVLAFAAHAVLTGQLAGRWPRAGARALGAVLAVAAVPIAVWSTGGGPLVVTGAGAVPAGLLIGVLAAGAALLGLTWWRVPRLRPVATGAAALLLVAALPGPHATTAVLLAVPVLAVLAAVQVKMATPAAPRWRAGLVLAAAVGVAVATSGPVVVAATAPDPDRSALGEWVAGQLDPAVRLQVDPLTAAQLVEDGLAGDRLVPAGAVPPPGTPVVRAGAAAPPAVDGRLLLALPDGPGGGPVEVRMPGAGPDGTAERTAIGMLLAGDSAVITTEPAAEALRSGEVDVRLTAALAWLASAHRFTVAGFPVAPGEPAGAPLRTALLTAVDGRPAGGAGELAARMLTDPRSPFGPGTVTVDGDALVVRYPITPAGPGR
jgi:putative peptide zinc metalloprotease protein